MPDQWDPCFFLDSPLFSDISKLANYFKSYSQWPNIQDYNQFLCRHHPEMLTGNQARIHFVAQGAKPHTYEEQYEPRIYLKGEIQTRLENWHDFFQVMIWNLYPLTKKHINELHYQAIYKKHLEESAGNQRGDIENTLTLFDECGAIIVSSKPELLELIATFQWKELFIRHKEAFNRKIYCFTFGHALYEKSLSPYIGMTAHAILIEVDDGFFTKTADEQAKTVDRLGVDFFDSAEKITTKLLHPFPVLGVPGWDSRNQNPGFYENKRYFRPGKQA